MHPSFAAALHADGPAADRARKMGLYAWLIGDWEMDGIIHGEDGRYEARGEIHAGWVLEGRAIQDVWILPGAFYGSTLRVYDPARDAWHILWSDPTKQYYTRQLGRANGDDIVQEGTNDSGDTVRWKFTERKLDSFHWIGERLVSADTWKLEAEFFARRAANGKPRGARE
jgi:hypothetical protein